MWLAPTDLKDPINVDEPVDEAVVLAIRTPVVFVCSCLDERTWRDCLLRQRSSYATVDSALVKSAFMKIFSRTKSLIERRNCFALDMTILT